MSLTENSEVTRWQNRPVRKRRNHSRERKAPLFLFLLGGFFFVGLLCMHCWQKMKMLEFGYQIEMEKKLITEMEEKHRQLKLEEAFLLSPARINQLAYDRLGMVIPAPHQILFDTDSAMDNTGTMAMSVPNELSRPQSARNY